MNLPQDSNSHLERIKQNSPNRIMSGQRARVVRSPDPGQAAVPTANPAIMHIKQDTQEVEII